MLSVWNAVVFGDGAAAIIRWKQLLGCMPAFWQRADRGVVPGRTQLACSYVARSDTRDAGEAALLGG
jgi:hypothetical protein